MNAGIIGHVQQVEVKYTSWYIHILIHLYAQSLVKKNKSQIHSNTKATDLSLTKVVYLKPSTYYDSGMFTNPYYI